MAQTTQGKAAALKALEARRKRFKKAPTFDNSSTHAGTPMYYRCAACGDPQGICVPEGWLSKPSLCDECTALKACGWLE